MINTGCSNNRSAEISADVFNGNIRGAEIRLYTNIKPIRVIRVHFIFNFTKRWANTGNKLLKQYFTEGVPKKVIIKMFDRAPWGDIAGAAFGNEGVDVGIPFQITPKGVKDTDESGGKVFSFIHFGKHAEDNIADRME